MSDQPAFACTLTPAELSRRGSEDLPLSEQLAEVRVREPRHAVLAFPRGAEPLVREFARKESACCAFFSFDVQTSGDTAVLDVTAPAGAEGMLEGLVDHLLRQRQP